MDKKKMRFTNGEPGNEAYQSLTDKLNSLNDSDEQMDYLISYFFKNGHMDSYLDAMFDDIEILPAPQKIDRLAEDILTNWIKQHEQLEQDK